MRHVNAVITYHSLVGSSARQQQQCEAAPADAPQGWQLMTDFQPVRLKATSNVHCRTRRMRNMAIGWLWQAAPPRTLHHTRNTMAAGTHIKYCNYLNFHIPGATVLVRINKQQANNECIAYTQGKHYYTTTMWPAVCISSGYSITAHNTHLLLIGLAPVMSLIDAIRHREPPEQQRLRKYRNVH